MHFKVVTKLTNVLVEVYSYLKESSFTAVKRDAKF